ncbi:MAG: MAPEG family protein [Pseudomonadota bacterium]
MVVDTQIIAPVIALVAWSLVMWIWMYLTRIPAVQAAELKLDPNVPRGQQMSTLPPRVRWKADNYTHLMEQPTIFYALALSLAVLGEGSGVNLILAWAYVILRVVHSLVQALLNKIEVRFLVFVLSNVPLFWLSVNAIVSITEGLPD